MLSGAVAADSCVHVLESADRLASGASARKGVGVQISAWTHNLLNVKWPNGARVMAMSAKTPVLQQVLDLLDLDSRYCGLSPNDELLAKMRDQIIEFRMYGVGFGSCHDLVEGYDWGEDWIAEHPDEWARYASKGSVRKQ